MSSQLSFCPTIGPTFYPGIIGPVKAQGRPINTEKHGGGVCLAAGFRTGVIRTFISQSIEETKTKYQTQVGKIISARWRDEFPGQKGGSPANQQFCDVAIIVGRKTGPFPSASPCLEESAFPGFGL